MTRCNLSEIVRLLIPVESSAKSQQSSNRSPQAEVFRQKAQLGAGKSISWKCAQSAVDVWDHLDPHWSLCQVTRLIWLRNFIQQHDPTFFCRPKCLLLTQTSPCKCQRQTQQGVLTR